MSALLSKQQVREWQRVRRHAVPGWMIEQATERRLAGDWRGACAAANMDVEIDLRAIARHGGTAVAAELSADLTHLAPDLLRWHLPREASGGRLSGHANTVPLTRYADGSALIACLPSSQRPQRVTLRHRPFPAELERWTMHRSRELWDARSAPGLLARTGGVDRLPYFTADGRRRPTEEQQTLAERIIALQDGGFVEEAWALAGLTLDLSPDRSARGTNYLRRYALEDVRALRADLPGLAGLARRAKRETGAATACLGLPSFTGYLLFGKRGLVTLVASDEAGSAATIPTHEWERPVDFDLVRLGYLRPDALHPLVREAFFPTAAAIALPQPEPDELPRLRVRCGGEWHWLGMRDGTFNTEHPTEEHRRELTLRALGGAKLTGCTAACQGWREQGIALPKALRLLRRDVGARAAHGDGPGLGRLLDAGLDPHMRDGEGHTLLHLLHLLPDAELLPRLLAAGLDLEARDGSRRTPLVLAAAHGAVEVVRALLAAGADTGALTNDELGAMWERLR